MEQERLLTLAITDEELLIIQACAEEQEAALIFCMVWIKANTQLSGKNWRMHALVVKIISQEPWMLPTPDW